jgi:hypothetical protein
MLTVKKEKKIPAINLPSYRYAKYKARHTWYNAQKHIYIERQESAAAHVERQGTQRTRQRSVRKS